MAEALSRVLGVHFVVPWLCCKKLQVPLHITQQKVSHITAEAFLYDNAQGRQVFSILGKRISGHQPAAIAEPFREIKDGKIRCFFKRESKNRNIASIADELKWPQLRNLTGEVEGNILAGLVDTRVSFFAQTQKIIVLRHHLIARP